MSQWPKQQHMVVIVPNTMGEIGILLNNVSIKRKLLLSQFVYIVVYIEGALPYKTVHVFLFIIGVSERTLIMRHVLAKQRQICLNTKCFEAGVCSTHLLHNTAPCHCSAVYLECLKEQHFNILPHYPNSHDLYPCDFLLKRPVYKEQGVTLSAHNSQFLAEIIFLNSSISRSFYSSPV